MTTDTATKTTPRTKVKYPNMWRVVFHNDDYTPMNFVTQVLIELFDKSPPDAHEIMLTVHHSGKAQVGLYTKEIADQKCNEVKRVAESYGHPLLATAEET